MNLLCVACNSVYSFDYFQVVKFASLNGGSLFSQLNYGYANCSGFLRESELFTVLQTKWYRVFCSQWL